MGRAGASILGVLLALLLVTAASAFIGSEFYFFLGVLACGSIASRIGFPLAFVCASVSLLRGEPCPRLALGSLWIALLLALGVGYFAVLFFNTPLRLFN